MAIHYRLADNFSPNSKGIAPTDVQVVNDYVLNDDRNPHKDYGYLRTTELARLCFDFLSAEQSLASIHRQDALFKTHEGALKLLRLS